MPYMLMVIFLFLIAVILFYPFRLKIYLRKCPDEEDFYIKLFAKMYFLGKDRELSIIMLHLQELLPYIWVKLTAGTHDDKTTTSVHVKYNWLNKIKYISTSEAVTVYSNFIKAILVNKKVLKKVKCESFVWKTCFGLGDPALTGLAGGCLWAFKELFFIFLRNHLNVTSLRPELIVVPLFTEKVITISFNCIFVFRLGYIIMAGYNYLIMNIKQLFTHRWC
ncbi:MAG: DUF2953 domain-containing protein [Bacillota bacterium]